MWQVWKHIPSKILLRAYSNAAKPAMADRARMLTQMKSIGSRLNLSEEEGVKLEKLLKGTRSTIVNPKKNLDMMTELGMSEAQQKKVVLSCSSMFSVRSEIIMRKWAWFVQNIGFTNEEMVKLVARHPTIFSRSLQNKIEPIVSELKGLGLDRSDIKGVLTDASQILSISLEKRLKPRIACLKELEFGEEELRTFIRKFPWSLEKNIPPKVEWMKTTLELDTQHLRELIVSHPKLLNVNLESTTESFQYLLKQGLTRWQSLDLIVLQPSRTVLRSGSLVDKIEFAKNVLKKDVSDVVDWSEYVTRPFRGHIGLRTSFLAREGCKYWDQPLSALFVFGDEGFLNIHLELWPSISKGRFYEHKQWWNALSDDDKEKHLDLLSKPKSTPWKS